MRNVLVMLLTFGFAGCSAAPTVPLPSAPPKFAMSSANSAGDQVSEIYRYCLAAAAQSCPAATIRCDSYRPAYVQGCLLKGNVPPEYITALIR